MEYGSRWAEPPPAAVAAPPHQHHQHRPDPYAYNAPTYHHHNLNAIHLQQPLPHSSSYHYYPDPNPNPSPNPRHDNPLPPATAGGGGDVGVLRPPASEPYAPNPYAPYEGYEGYRAAPYSYPGGGPAPAAEAGAASSYYYGGGGGGGGGPHGFAVKEAVRQYGFDPRSYGALVARSLSGPELSVPPRVVPPHRNRMAMHPASRSAMRKRIKRATKVVQSAYCEVCKIDCNSPDVLKSHKQGKKHKKNLQKLQESITAKPAKAPTPIVEKKEAPVAEKSKVVGEQSKKKGGPATAAELEAKKRRVLEGGAAEDGVKVCTICNVVVNSQKVFDFHIAGQKHAAVVKQLQERQADKAEK